MSIHGHNREKDGSGKWPFTRMEKMFNSGEINIANYAGWGWKEPNSHLLIDYMNDFFPNFKYIHTIRNGLDMAFSQNQQQLYNWGNLYGVPPPADQEKVPEASFRYWASVNKHIQTKVSLLGSEKLMLLNFDNLCREPEKEIRHLLLFLGIQPDQVDLDTLLAIPQEPPSSGRFQSMSINWLTQEDKKLLVQLGFL